ncbi:hypothetical protein AYO21_02910 [Fonsecaea monophora]|uniref:TRAM domain-containing protein n=1 Tax=Fonsecaea monophora TaxID=254056 RepID=A0A177FIK0_9EURO|nr:hypothetical protein AYO21_02910 [Fonsecaea monophora]KAH0847659.1 tRNA(m5U54)methyltransferase [Fonsecaea pedrosoi]OAG42959.1 hypothetical protein AYO21_02910 [Fonsecaea monophora]
MFLSRSLSRAPVYPASSSSSFFVRQPGANITAIRRTLSSVEFFQPFNRSSGRDDRRLPRPQGYKEVYNAASIAARMDKLNNRGPMARAKRHRLQQQRSQLQDGTPDQVLTIEAESLLLLRKERRERNGDDGHDGPDHDGQEGGQEGDQRHPPTSLSSRSSHQVEAHTEVELEIEELSSTGDGLAYAPGTKDLIYVVPFAVPGDRVLAKTFPQKEVNPLWSRVDFVKLLRPSPRREGVTPGCQYFGTCSGCQLQMLPYPEQLAHKKTIVEKAFKHFSNLDPSRIPPVDDTMGSPLQYGYRTKLTPHYSGGSKSKPFRQGDDPPPLGFMRKNSPRILDIEQCPIGTPILNEGLKIERRKMHESFWKSKTGATVLLRESTRREMVSPTTDSSNEKPLLAAESSSTRDVGGDGAGEEGENIKAPSPGSIHDLSSLPLAYSGDPVSTELSFPSPTTPQITYTYPLFRDIKTYTSDHKAVTTEHIGPYTFTTRANSFFQNNNSILPIFLSYIRENLLPKTPAAGSGPAAESATAPTASSSVSWVPGNNHHQPEAQPAKIKYLLDAYCGSGLFSIALAPYFSSVLGIDIDALSISCARDNANLNHRANSRPKQGGTTTASDATEVSSNTGFIAADAQALFTDVPFPPSQTLLVIDPPRKGASPDFLQQLCTFGPRRVVYVSCNVHTQARDVGMLVAGFGGGRWRYDIEKLGGFDFFPQTGHVEGVCFLNRAERQS